MKLTRNQFLKTVGIASAGVAGGNALASTYTGAPDVKTMKPDVGEKQLQNGNKIKLGVSTYCYQHAIYTGEMTTEDCLAEIHSIGAEGVQIIDAITIADFPNPTEAWVDKWLGWMDKYKLTPTLVDTFVDYNWGGRHKEMTLQEAIANVVSQLRIAKRLGFSIVRPSSRPIGTPWPELWEGAVPYAEDLGMKIAPELHSPIPLKGEFVDRIMDIISRTGTKNLGVTLDMGEIPYRNYYPLIREESIRGGQITREIVLYIEQSKENGVTKDKVLATVKKMKPKPGDLEYVEKVYSSSSFSAASGYRYEGQNPGDVTNKPEDIKPLLPYIFNIHGKFFEMTDDCVETSLNYSDVFKVLVEAGWEGFIDSEYEGQRHLHDQYCEPVNEVGQVRRHHIMMRKLLGRV
jgi:sugar phosphate isomerase/epimerase